MKIFASFKRAISICLLLTFTEVNYPAALAQDNGTTLSPPSRFAPLVTEQDLSITEKNLRELSLSADFKEYVGFIYLSVVISKIIERYGPDMSLQSFKELIASYGPDVKFVRFDPDGMSKDGPVFSMPYKKRDGSRFLVNYCLRDNLPEAAVIEGKPVSLGLTDVCVFIQEKDGPGKDKPAAIGRELVKEEAFPAETSEPAGDMISGLLDFDTALAGDAPEARVFSMSRRLRMKLENDGKIALTDKEFLDLLEAYTRFYSHGLSKEMNLALLYAIRNEPRLFSVLEGAMETMRKKASSDRMGAVFSVYDACFSADTVRRKAAQADMDFLNRYFDGFWEFHYWRRTLFHSLMTSNPDLEVTTDGIKFMRESLLEGGEAVHSANFFAKLAGKTDILPYIATEGMPDLALAPDALSGVVARGNGPGFERLRKEEPSIYNLLFDPENARKLMTIASTLRKIFPYTKLSEQQGLKPPFEQALEEKVYFHLGGDIYISPYTESFRRHVIFRKDASGNVAYAVEIKIPGEFPNKKKINAGDYELSRTINRFFPDASVSRPVAFISYPFRRIQLYGEETEYDPEGGHDDKCNMSIFELDDGRRLSSLHVADIKAIAERYPARYSGDGSKAARDITRQTLRLVAIFHAMNYAGTDDAGTDMHLNNFKVILGETGPEIYFCGDFGEYSVDHFDREKYLGMDMANMVKGVVRGGRTIYYGLSTLFGAGSPGEKECYDIYMGELEKAKMEFLENERSIRAERTDNFLREMDPVLRTNRVIAETTRVVDGREWPVKVTDDYIRCGDIVFVPRGKYDGIPAKTRSQFAPDMIVLDETASDIAAVITPLIDSVLLLQARGRSIRHRNVLNVSGESLLALVAGKLGAKAVYTFEDTDAVFYQTREAIDINMLANCTARAGDPYKSDEWGDIGTILAGPGFLDDPARVNKFASLTDLMVLNVKLEGSALPVAVQNELDREKLTYEVVLAPGRLTADLIVNISEASARMRLEAKKDAVALISAMRKLAMDASGRNEKILVAIDTSWMPEGAGLQALLSELCEADKDKGFENMIIIRGKTADLVRNIQDVMKREGPGLPKANVLVIAENGFLDSTALMDFLKDSKPEESAFFVGVDPKNLGNNIFDGKIPYVRLMDILRCSIRAAFDGKFSDLEKIKGAEESRSNGARRWLIVPTAEREDIEILHDRYEQELTALHAA
jgi:hypothetical protein